MHCIPRVDCGLLTSRTSHCGKCTAENIGMRLKKAQDERIARACSYLRALGTMYLTHHPQEIKLFRRIVPKFYHHGAAGKIDARKGSEIAKVMIEVVIHNIGGTRTWKEIKSLRKNQNGRRLVNRGWSNLSKERNNCEKNSEHRIQEHAQSKELYRASKILIYISYAVGFAEEFISPQEDTEPAGKDLEDQRLLLRKIFDGAGRSMYYRCTLKLKVAKNTAKTLPTRYSPLRWFQYLRLKKEFRQLTCLLGNMGPFVLQFRNFDRQKAFFIRYSRKLRETSSDQAGTKPFYGGNF
ncbi:hypothetical protein G5I_01607 [Acromyrmex echinatior]|uniref:Uncharacterized protein n=1 Tax=Acromyrmex echinatior TaxID=103372 RepID=F4W830_ACREC|nr:hypothetical protein G5I_01607 [Acromyrmex echinatior]